MDSIAAGGRTGATVGRMKRVAHAPAPQSRQLLKAKVYRGDTSGTSARIALDAARRRQQHQRDDARLSRELISEEERRFRAIQQAQRAAEAQAGAQPAATASMQDIIDAERDEMAAADLAVLATAEADAAAELRAGDGAPSSGGSAAPPAPGGAAPPRTTAAAERQKRQALQAKLLRAQQRPGKGAIAYRPTTALGLARRRMLNKFFPYEWQITIRRKLEEIPETQFNYIVSGLTLVATSLLAGVAAWCAWPFTRETVITLFHANDIEARVLQELTFETQFLSAISLVTAILLGNTFAFSFDRQRSIIQEMSEEVFAVELLLQEAFLELPEPHLRWRIIKHVRKYVEHEIQARTIDSPFRVDGAIVGLFSVLASLRDEGRDIARMLRAVEMLAQAKSRRVSVAAALLPPLHWVMLASLCGLLLVSFILFDSDFNNEVVENRVIFALLAAMLYSILQVLQDIASPDDGLYSVRDAMDNRLTYVRWQMNHILNDPAIKVSILGGEIPEDLEDDAPIASGSFDSSEDGIHENSRF